MSKSTHALPLKALKYLTLRGHTLSFHRNIPKCWENTPSQTKNFCLKVLPILFPTPVMDRNVGPWHEFLYFFSQYKAEISGKFKSILCGKISCNVNVFVCLFHYCSPPDSTPCLGKGQVRLTIFNHHILNLAWFFFKKNDYHKEKKND